jgi:hypothetical protein
VENFILNVKREHASWGPRSSAGRHCCDNNVSYSLFPPPCTRR